MSRTISWIKAARKDFEGFPREAQERLAFALALAAGGSKADIARPMKGLGAGVMEIALPYRGNAFRVVALQIGDALWVVHAFQKKSTKGIETPQKEVELVRSRLKSLREILK